MKTIVNLVNMFGCRAVALPRSKQIVIISRNDLYLHNATKYIPSYPKAVQNFFKVKFRINSGLIYLNFPKVNIA